MTKSYRFRLFQALLTAATLAALLAACDLLDRFSSGSSTEPVAEEGTRDEDSSASGEREANTDEPDERSASASERTLSGPMAGVYKFTDDRGVIHYVDHIDKVPPRYRKRAHHPTGGAVTVVPATPIDDLQNQGDGAWIHP